MTPSHIHRHSNGLVTVVMERPATHQVRVLLMVRVGSRFESADELGISHFLEHVLFRGCEGFPDGDALNRAFEEVGGMLDAHTGVETTDFDMTVHPAKLSEGLGVLARFLRSPVFAELEKEREILLDELAYDYNEQGRMINPAILAAELMWPDHPLGRCVGGVPATISALGEKHIRTHHARYFRPENMVLGLAGRLDGRDAIAMVEGHFGDWKSAPGDQAENPAASPLPAHRPGAGGSGGPGVKVVPDSGNQFHLQISLPAPGYNDAAELTAILLTRILDDGPTSRLQRVIREQRALVYHIDAGYSAYWDAGTLDIATSVATGRLDNLLKHLFEELSRFRRDGPTQDELERARMRHLYDLDFEGDSLSAQLGRYAWPQLYSTVREVEEEREGIGAITLEHLREMAGSLISRENARLALVGPADSETERRLKDALARWE
ncbi:MAG: pitrilysin family protein [bacterium]